MEPTLDERYISFGDTDAEPESEETVEEPGLQAVIAEEAARGARPQMRNVAVQGPTRYTWYYVQPRFVPIPFNNCGAWHHGPRAHTE